MRNFNKILAITLLGGSSLLAQPQNGNLGQLELSITDKYKGKVTNASKYIDFPSFKDTTTKKLDVNYRINSQPVDVNFSPRKLPPVKITQISLEKLPRGLVRLGYGFYNSALAEFYYNSGRSSKYNFGFSGRHASTTNGVDGIIFDNNGMSNNELGTYLNRFYKKMAWHTDAFANFNKVSYYGVDRVAAGDAIPEAVDPPHNWYRTFGLNTNLLSTNNKAMGWLQNIGIRYYNMTDDYSSMENNFQLLTELDIPAADKNINTDLNLTYFKTEYDSLTSFNQSYLTFQAHPRISSIYRGLVIDFGLNLFYNSALDSAGLEDGQIFFFPEVVIKYPIVKDVLITYGGIEGSLRHNTLNSLVVDNPFLNPGQYLRPSRTTDIFIGMNGILSSSTSFNLKGGYSSTNDFALYFRNPFYYLDSIDPGISVLYDNVDRFYVRGELLVNLQNNLEINLSGELNSYDPETSNKAWHLPSFTSELSALYTLKDKIKTKAKLRYVGARDAFEQSLNADVPSGLPAYLDASLGIEYLYNSRLSAFINANNLFDANFDYYLGYQTQGINVLFGISYQF